MNACRVRRAGIIGLAVVGILTASWVLPPFIHQSLRLCPVRPDGVSEASALPQFARRYGVDCAVCHTVVPRLTPVGYKFRRAGFRMPDEYGEEAKFTGLKDIYGVRVRQQYTVNAAATDATAANVKVPATNAFTTPELNLYPISGAFGKWWATRTELAVTSGEAIAVENAYIRATYPKGDWIFSTRAGIMHPYEGYGGSDESFGNFDPLFLSNSAKNGAFDTGVMLVGQNQSGAEGNIGYKDSTLSVAILNGYNTLKTAANKADDNNLRDLRVFFNQMIGERAAASVLYVNGKTSQPTDVTATITAAGGTNAATWINNYERLALFASCEVLGPKLNLLGGFGIGRDHLPRVLTAATDNTDRFNNTGWFGEVQSKLHEHLTAGARYDTFKPSTRTAGNRLSSLTFTAAMPFEYIKFLADYQIARAQSLIGKDRTDNKVILEWQAAF